MDPITPEKQSIAASSFAYLPTTSKVMLYTTVTETDAKLLRKAAFGVEEKKLLKIIFGLDKEEHNPKVAELLLDFYMVNLNFAKRKHYYSDEKISTFLGIMHYTLNNALKNNLSQRDMLALFKNLLQTHSLARPPDEIGLFDKKDLIELEDFFMKTLYRHYPLYETAIKQKAELTLKTLDITKREHLTQPPIDNSMKELRLEDVPLLITLLEQINKTAHPDEAKHEKKAEADNAEHEGEIKEAPKVEAA